MDADENANTSQVEGNDGTTPSAGNLEEMLLRLSVQDVEIIRNELQRREEEIQRRDKEIQEFKEETERLRGLAFADLLSVCQATSAIVDIADYESFVREWDENQFMVKGLKNDIYSETRKEALKIDNEASISQAITEITRYQPIKLTSKLTRAVAQKAISAQRRVL